MHNDAHIDLGRRRSVELTMSELHAARCIDITGPRATFDLVTIHPDAMGRAYPFNINPFFVLQLLFEHTLQEEQDALPAWETGEERERAAAALARQVIGEIEVVSTANEDISEDAFSDAFDRVNQSADDDGASFLDQQTGLPRVRFVVEVADPRRLHGLPVNRAWMSTAYAYEPRTPPDETPRVLVICDEVRGARARLRVFFAWPPQLYDASGKPTIPLVVDRPYALGILLDSRTVRFAGVTRDTLRGIDDAGAEAIARRYIVHASVPEPLAPEPVLEIEAAEPIIKLVPGQQWTAVATRDAVPPPAKIRWQRPRIDSERQPWELPRGVLPLRPGLDAHLTIGDLVRVELESRQGECQSCDGVVIETATRGTRPDGRAVRWEPSSASVLLTGAAPLLEGEWLARFHPPHGEDDGEGGSAQRLTLTSMVPATAEALSEYDRDQFGYYAVASAAAVAKTGDHLAAIAICSRALALTRDTYRADVQFLRATARAQLGDHAAAFADWNAMLAVKPNHQGGLVGRAKTYLALGNRDLAIADLRRASELGSNDAASLLRIHAAAPPPSNRVVHTTYGEGTIVRRLDGDKLEIDFAAAGKKTLLARFVKPVT